MTTAKELIEHLQKLPQDTRVLIPDQHNLRNDIVVSFYPDDGVCSACVVITPRDHWAQQKD